MEYKPMTEKELRKLIMSVLLPPEEEIQLLRRMVEYMELQAKEIHYLTQMNRIAIRDTEMKNHLLFDLVQELEELFKKLSNPFEGDTIPTTEDFRKTIIGAVQSHIDLSIYKEKDEKSNPTDQHQED